MTNDILQLTFWENYKKGQFSADYCCQQLTNIPDSSRTPPESQRTRRVGIDVPKIEKKIRKYILLED
jgi:hypothetical protein